MKKLLLSALVLTAPLAAMAAPLVDLSGGYYTYGNVNSYSMPLVGIDIKSGPGQIKDSVVIYTGADGKPVTTNVAGFDDAYGAPNGTKTYASISGAINMQDPGDKAGIANNNTNTWDANLLALKGYLGTATALFLFNNNDTNEDQNLAIWAKVWLTDGGGSLYGRYLYLSNAGAGYGLGGIANGDATLYNPGNVIAPTAGFAATDYVLSGGQVLGVNHNLGADRVAYAADVPLLNDWLDTLFALNDAVLGGYTMHLDLKLGCISATAWGTCDNVKIDNGYEQLFLVANDRNSVTLVPEPGLLGLFGVALALLAVVRRRESNPQA